jgi:phenylalanyl-tRNA synthetase beta chain
VKAPASWIRELGGLSADITTDALARGIADTGFEIASIDGEVIDFEITANRPDCLSVRGLAREAGTKFRSAEVPGFRSSGVPESRGAEVRVEIASPLCGRFALAMADVTVGPSPQWLIDRLTACGVRAINNIVDITNYVMLEMGQPMHAYDATKVAGSRLVARLATKGETLTTLDGVKRTLDGSMLVIADDSGAVGVAGVMGGAASEVSSSTTRIALEAAYFQPATVRATSKRLGLKTEASTRFERGADVNGGPEAIAMALELLERIGAGTRASATTDVYPIPHSPRTVTLRPTRLARLLGDTVPAEEVERILSSLGFVLTAGADSWSVTVPSWRVDVAREADLIEEVGRHWGVNRVPASFPALQSAPRVSDAGVLRSRRLRRLLCGAGLQEAVTFTFMERSAAEPFVAEGTPLVEIANPLSEKFSVLRPSIVPGLLDALIYNRRRGIDDVRLFEAGAIFAAAGESQQVGWVLCGARDAHWSQPATPVDIFDALGVAAVLADAWGVTLTSSPTAAAGYVPGRTAQLAIDGRAVGIVGQIDSRVAESRGLPQGSHVVAGCLDLGAFAGDGAAITKVAAVPRFPAVVRDVALLVADNLPAAALRATIRQQPIPWLRSVVEFDRYQGRNIPAGKVSLAFRLTFQDDGRTLTDTEVDDAFTRIVEALIAEHGAEVRGR